MEGSTGDASGDDHFIGWRPRQAQRCEMLGKAGSARVESLDATGSIGSSSAGSVGVAQPGVRCIEAAAEVPVTAAPTNAYVNPFLAASQNWHPCDSDESSAEESGVSTSSLPEPSRQLSSAANPFAAAAEQWLAARQQSLAETDIANTGPEKPPASQTAATAARQSSRNVSDHSSHGRQSPVGSPRAQHKQERSGRKHMAASQADQEMRSPFEAPQLQQRSPKARAGPPPAKGVFRNSLAESSLSGESAAYCTGDHSSHKPINMVTCFVP